MAAAQASRTTEEIWAHSKVAEEEGFKEIARTFNGIAKVESYHERRYRKLMEKQHPRQILRV
jgi:rubrerythrin